MKIKEILTALEELAPLALQEDYDNAGLVTGHPGDEAGGCLICLDISEEIVEEAIQKKCNLIISHHPVIFKGLKKLTGQTMTERIIARAIRENIAICSMHTNLDNVSEGVNRTLAEKLGLVNLSVLRKTEGMLRKLVTFCPVDYAQKVREALFSAGAGHIGAYDQCSFNAEGLGSFRAGDKADPFVGSKGEIHFEKETRIETIFPSYLKKNIIAALLEAHPYEEVAYDIYTLENEFNLAGSGMIGELPAKVSELVFLQLLKDTLKIPVIRHSPLLGKLVGKVALCGGSGSFLIQDAIRHQADFFVSADIKYHQFFEAEGKLVIADAGHYETEQFTCNLLADYLKKKFANFAVQISETPVNPVNYFLISNL
jgi:dinuclear metal center YbgI/SA1388 family protein